MSQQWEERLKHFENSATSQRIALRTCHLQGIRRSLLSEIWHSYDLGVIRDAVRILSDIPEQYKSRFNSALKQMSG